MYIRYVTPDAPMRNFKCVARNELSCLDAERNKGGEKKIFLLLSSLFKRLRDMDGRGPDRGV